MKGIASLENVKRSQYFYKENGLKLLLMCGLGFLSVLLFMFQLLLEILVLNS